jgi:hypothetical protein
VTRFLDATRERFLMAIAASLPAERFLELHFFSPIRQGGVESGVAVIAAHLEIVAPPILADAPPPPEDELTEAPPPNENRMPRRYTVYSAKYRLVLKGPDRGKWECTVVAEADAPLITVETVVRGVQRRAGDAEEPERMSGDEARDFVLAASR